MWQSPSTHISANLPTASTNNWDSRDLDTATRLWSVLWHPLIFLSRPLPDFWHPVIFLWPLHRHCVHYSQVFCHPSQRARSVPCPPTTQTWVPTCTQCMSDHLTTHPTALLPPTDETISRNLYRPHLPTHRAYSFSCFVSSELSWYVQPDTKTYQVTIWRRLSPTDINVGTWVFVIDFGKRVYGGNISMKENIQYGWCPSHRNCPNPLSNKCLCNLCNLNQWNVWGWQCEVKACICKVYHLHSNTLIKIL